MTEQSTQRHEKEKINIAYLLEATFGGTRKHLMYLATSLDQSRFDLTVICSTRRNPSFTDDIETLLKRGVHVKVIQMARPIRPFADLAARVRFYAFFRKGSYDIVHAHSSKAGFLGRMAARMARVPVVLYSPHAFAFQRGILGTNGWYLLLERIAARFTDAIIAVSDGERETALQYHVTGKDGVITIKNAIDISEFDPACDAGDLKAELGIADAPKIVGMVGRICTQKGYRYFIEAAAQVTKERPDIRFVLVGNGNLARARYEIDQCGAGKSVILAGQREDMPRLYALFDVVVVPSLWEGLPYVILEAMAMGKPVIATRIPGNSEVVDHGETGYLVRPGDAREIAAALLGILGDAATAAEMGRRGRAAVEGRFALDQNISAFECMYERVMRRRK
jgi:glycosyltransferase involved in cell wall biosynthesis